MKGTARVVLYGRPGCSLCDEARTLLRPLGRELGFDIEDVNIESDDALLRRFMFEIPVVCVDGMVVAKAPLYRTALREAVAGALGAG